MRHRPLDIGRGAGESERQGDRAGDPADGAAKAEFVQDRVVRAAPAVPAGGLLAHCRDLGLEGFEVCGHPVTLGACQVPLTAQAIDPGGRIPFLRGGSPVHRGRGLWIGGDGHGGDSIR